MKQREIFGSVFTLESIVAGAVFLAVLVLFGWALFARRAKRDVRPSRRSEHTPFEVFYVSVLAAFAVFLVVWTAWQNHREHTTAHQEPVRVDVTAFQWCWRFGYPQAPRERTVTGTCRGDDMPTLVVPTGRPVELTMTSRDVIHSLWVPDLRYKRDVFPHHTNRVTLTLDKQGRWQGTCAEFCGDRHYAMHFWIKAVSPERYDRWLQGQSAGGQGGAAA